MKTLDVKAILGSKVCPWFKLLRMDVDRQTAAGWFNCAPHVEWVDGFGDADYWAVEFVCRLKVAFEFPHHGSGASVLATEPVPKHVERHLCHWRNELHEYPLEAFEIDQMQMIERFASAMPALTELRSFQLWRQGDDGNQVKVGEPTSECDAACWQAELESHKHKQIYWVTRIDDNRATSMKGRTKP